MWDTWLYGTVFLGTLKHILLCTSPGYVGQLGWAVECPIYPGSTVHEKIKEKISIEKFIATSDLDADTTYTRPHSQKPRAA